MFVLIVLIYVLNLQGGRALGASEGLIQTAVDGTQLGKKIFISVFMSNYNRNICVLFFTCKLV